MACRVWSIIKRAWTTERTIVWECPKYLSGTYSYKSTGVFCLTDLVEEALSLMPERATHAGYPVLRSDIYLNIRVTSVF